MGIWRWNWPFQKSQKSHHFLGILQFSVGISYIPNQHHAAGSKQQQQQQLQQQPIVKKEFRMIRRHVVLRHHAAARSKCRVGRRVICGPRGQYSELAASFVDKIFYTWMTKYFVIEVQNILSFKYKKLGTSMIKKIVIEVPNFLSLKDKIFCHSSMKN